MALYLVVILSVLPAVQVCISKDVDCLTNLFPSPLQDMSYFKAANLDEKLFTFYINCRKLFL